MSLATGEVRQRRQWTWWGQHHAEEVTAEIEKQAIENPEATKSQGGKHTSGNVDRVRKELWFKLTDKVREQWKDPGAMVLKADV